jgi:2-keto-4-pentenoate hydratase
VTAFTDDDRVRKGLETQLATRRQRLAAGEKPLGWKMGFGAPGALALMKIPMPLIGYLMQDALLPSGASVNVKDYAKPVAEPEVAVRLGSAIAAGSTPAKAKASINAVKPAIEIADLNIPPAPDAVEAILAGDIFQRHVVLGEAARAGGSIEGLTASIVRRGAQAGHTAELEALTGKIPDLLVHLADTLAVFGEKISAGDLVICGSIFPPPMIEPAETEFGYSLAPIGDISVRFTR